MIPSNIKITIEAPELAKALDSVSLALIAIAQAGPRAAKKVANSTGATKAAPKKEAPKKEAPKKEAPKKEAPKKEAPPKAEEEAVHDEAGVTAKAKELVAATSPAHLRAVLDAVIGQGVKISTAPKEKYSALYSAITEKLEERAAEPH